jgi:hypothetical protein
MRNTKFMALALAASVASGLLGAKTSAAPTNGMAAVSQQVANEIQKVRWWRWHRWGWSHPSWRREKLVKDGMLNRL